MDHPSDHPLDHPSGPEGRAWAGLMPARPVGWSLEHHAEEEAEAASRVQEED